MYVYAVCCVLCMRIWIWMVLKLTGRTFGHFRFANFVHIQRQKNISVIWRRFYIGLTALLTGHWVRVDLE